MTRIKENSHFALVRGDDFEDYGNRIIQVDTTKQYENGGYGVYICEVADEEEINNEY